MAVFLYENGEGIVKDLRISTQMKNRLIKPIYERSGRNMLISNPTIGRSSRYIYCGSDVTLQVLPVLFEFKVYSRNRISVLTWGPKTMNTGFERG
jgi:hypothetical protein